MRGDHIKHHGIFPRDKLVLDIRKNTAVKIAIKRSFKVHTLEFYIIASCGVIF